MPATRSIQGDGFNFKLLISKALILNLESGLLTGTVVALFNKKGVTASSGRCVQGLGTFFQNIRVFSAVFAPTSPQ